MVAIFARASLVNHYKKRRSADAEKGNRKSDVKGRTPFRDIMKKVSAIWISGDVAQIMSIKGKAFMTTQREEMSQKLLI